MKTKPRLLPSRSLPVEPDLLIEPERQEVWHRQDEETAQEYRFFKAYCFMAEQATRVLKQIRSITRLATQLRVEEKDLLNLAKKKQWLKRATAYDNYMLDLEQVKREQELEKEAEKWAKRRNQQREMEWSTAQNLISKAQRMVEWPLFEEVIVSQTEEVTENGLTIKTVIVQEPTKWDIKDAAQIFAVASKLGRLASGMDTERKRFKIDFSLLSNEELEELEQMEIE